MGSNNLIGQMNPKNLSRSNSINGSIVDGNEASMFLAQEKAPSEVDSDAQRKKLKQSLTRAFEAYQPVMRSNTSNSEYTKNHHVEFETLSDNSKSQSSILGKRKENNVSKVKDSEMDKQFVE